MEEIFEGILVIPGDVIDREVQAAAKLKKSWERRLADLRATGKFRMRINGAWETKEEAGARIQSLLDSYANATAAIATFKIVSEDVTD